MHIKSSPVLIIEKTITVKIISNLCESNDIIVEKYIEYKDKKIVFSNDYKFHTSYNQQKKIEANINIVFSYLLNEVNKNYTPIFKKSFYEAILKLRDWDITKRPAWLGNFTNKYVYSVLGMANMDISRNQYGQLLQELKKRNPNKKYRYHQFLNSTGIKELKKHLQILEDIANSCQNFQEFDIKFKLRFKL